MCIQTTPVENPSEIRALASRNLLSKNVLSSDLPTREIGTIASCLIFHGLPPTENSDATSKCKRLPGYPVEILNFNFKS